MADRTDEESLDARVAAAATPEERAALLGLDFSALVHGMTKLYAISIIPVAAVFLLGTFTFPFDSDATLVGFLPFVGGTLTALLFAFVASFLWNLLAFLVARRLNFYSRQLVAIELRLVLVTFSIFLTTQLVHSWIWLAGVLIGTLCSQLFYVAGPVALVNAIRKNRRGLVEFARQYERFPTWLSLADGRVFWLGSALLIATAAAGLEVLLYAETALAILPVLAAGLLTNAAAVFAMSRNRRLVWLGAQGFRLASIIALTVGSSLVGP